MRVSPKRVLLSASEAVLNPPALLWAAASTLTLPRLQFTVEPQAQKDEDQSLLQRSSTGLNPDLSH